MLEEGGGVGGGFFRDVCVMWIAPRIVVETYITGEKERRGRTYSISPGGDIVRRKNPRKETPPHTLPSGTPQRGEEEDGTRRKVRRAHYTF